MSAWVDGTKVTFDLTGKLNDKGDIAVGCQVFTVPEVVKAGGKLKIEDKRVEITGLVGTLNGSLRVAFEGTDRVFDRHQVVGYGLNLKVEEPAPPEPTWQKGDVVEHSDGTALLRQASGRWVSDFATNTTWGDDQVDRWQRDGKLTVIRQRAKPDPATLSWQEGDRIEWTERGGVRTRRADGQWNYQDGSPVVGYTDALYEEDIARGLVTVLRKGGVDLPTAA